MEERREINEIKELLLKRIKNLAASSRNSAEMMRADVKLISSLTNSYIAFDKHIQEKSNNTI